jgi:hypothetical protein
MSRDPIVRVDATYFVLRFLSNPSKWNGLSVSPGSANWALVAYTLPPKSETPALLETYACSG